MAKKTKQQRLTIMLALIMLMRFVMRRVRPSALIRSRDSENNKSLAKVGLTTEIFDDLPRQSFHANGRPMEPMNMVLVGNEESVRRRMGEAGWYPADRVSLLSVSKAFFAIIFDKQYLTGPVTPLFVDTQREQMAFQKPTSLNRFRQRHHARIWPTEFLDSSGNPLWIVHASYDKNIKGTGAFNFPPTHEIDLDIDKERDLLAADLKAAGATIRGYVQFQKPFSDVNAFDDPFETDGRAVVIEMSK